MVTGLTNFKEHFRGFENQYVIIGGTACDLIKVRERRNFIVLHLPKVRNIHI